MRKFKKFIAIFLYSLDSIVTWYEWTRAFYTPRSTVHRQIVGTVHHPFVCLSACLSVCPLVCLYICPYTFILPLCFTSTFCFLYKICRNMVFVLEDIFKEYTSLLPLDQQYDMASESHPFRFQVLLSISNFALLSNNIFSWKDWFVQLWLLLGNCLL